MTDSHLPDHRLPAPPPEPAARERVVEVLTRLYADDRITSEDLEARLERVYHAASLPQLEAIVADLPAALPGAAPSTLPAEAGTAQRISATFSGQEQRVTGVVPRRLEARSRFGYVARDLTRARFEPGATEIDVRAFMGYVQIHLPAGVRVECRGRALFGFFSLKGGTGAEDAASVVRITGRASFGFAECFASGEGAALPPRAAAPPCRPGAHPGRPAARPVDFALHRSTHSWKPGVVCTRNLRGDTTMRFMVIVPATKESEAGVLPDAKILEAMTRFNEDLAKAGVLLAAEGLHPGAKGSRLKYEGGKVTVTDGPFAETKELIAGFWLIQAKSKDEAIAWMKKAPMGGGFELELRQVFESAEFGPALTPEIKAREQRIRAELTRRK